MLTNDGHFSADDFNSDVIPLTFANIVAPQSCEITLVDDLLIENPETFQLSLSLADPNQGSLSTSAAQPNMATATIIDDGKCTKTIRV